MRYILTDAICPFGTREKEFVSYYNGMKWSYIAFEKQIYCTNEVNISPHRMVCATRLLSKTDLSIGEVVEEAGFSNNSNFGKKFKEEVGMTPTQFRDRYK